MNGNEGWSLPSKLPSGKPIHDERRTIQDDRMAARCTAHVSPYSAVSFSSFCASVSAFPSCCAQASNQSVKNAVVAIIISACFSWMRVAATAAF